MSKQGKRAFVLWGVFTVLLTACLCLWRMGNYFGIRALDLMSFLILALSEAAVLYGYLTFYPENERRGMKAGWQDKVKTEIPGAVIVVIVLALAAMVSDMRGDYSFQYRWGFVPFLFVSFLIYLLPSAVLQGMIALLVKKKLRGSIKADSVIWKRYSEWKKTELFEKRLCKEERLGFIIVTISVLAAPVLGILGWGGFLRTQSIAFIGLLMAVSAFIGIAILSRRSKSYKDIGRLLRQIDVMADGNLELEAEEILDPDIRRSSEKLCGISKNLKHIMEKQMQAERMKIDLITNVSHDLKTPLTSMVGYIDLLRQEELSSEAKDYVEILGVKQEQLKNMIQDIFELSKSTSGTVELELEELDMKKLLEQTLGDMEDAIAESGVEVRKRLSEEPAKFVGDGKKMYRVFQNLISNALKYSLKGTRIYIEEVRAGKTIEVSIKNTASYEMDFTEEEVLERFTRADKARNTEGHGLGLAIAESFVKNIGGTFQVQIDGDQFKVNVAVEAL